MTVWVSVIVPVNNASAFLPALFEGLAAQTLRELEIILVDDGSTDGSAALCDAFAERHANVQVARHAAAQGVSSARNTGLALAIGEWIGFADADDVPEARLYETLWRAGQADNLDLVLCDARRFVERPGDRDDRLVKSPMPTQTLRGIEYFRQAALQDNFVMMVYLGLARRALIEECQLRFVPGIVNEDVLWMCELQLRSHKVRYLDEVLYHYRINADSITRRVDPLSLILRVKSYAVVIEGLLRMQSWADERTHIALEQVAVKCAISLVDHARKIAPLRLALQTVAQAGGAGLMWQMLQAAKTVKEKRRLLKGLLFGCLGALLPGRALEKPNE